VPFVGLVRSSDGWEPSDEPAPGPAPRRPWDIPWRALGWLAVLLALLFVAPVVSHLLGEIAGYLVILLAVGVGCWRMERFCAAQYWRGLRDYQA
jgi:hypothetical protein